MIRYFFSFFNIGMKLVFRRAISTLLLQIMVVHLFSMVNHLDNLNCSYFY
jgi:hypothetical protein